MSKPSGRVNGADRPPVGVGVLPATATGPGVDESLGDGLGLADGVGVLVSAGIGVAVATVSGVA